MQLYLHIGTIYLRCWLADGCLILRQRKVCFQEEVKNICLCIPAQLVSFWFIPQSFVFVFGFWLRRDSPTLRQWGLGVHRGNRSRTHTHTLMFDPQVVLVLLQVIQKSSKRGKVHFTGPKKKNIHFSSVRFFPAVFPPASIHILQSSFNVPKGGRKSFTAQALPFHEGLRDALQTSTMDEGEPKWLSKSLAHSTSSTVYNTRGNQLYKEHNAPGSNKGSRFCNKTGTCWNCFINKVCKLKASRTGASVLMAPEIRDKLYILQGMCLESRTSFRSYVRVQS